MQKIRQNGTLLDMFQKVSQIAIELAGQTNPQLAQEIAVAAQGIMGQATTPALDMNRIKSGLPEGDNMEAPRDPSRDNAIVSRARERTANASRPD